MIGTEPNQAKRASDTRRGTNNNIKNHKRLKGWTFNFLKNYNKMKVNLDDSLNHFFSFKYL